MCFVRQLIEVATFLMAEGEGGGNSCFYKVLFMV